MKEELVSLETAKLAKEKKFNEPTTDLWCTHDFKGNEGITHYQIYNESWNTYDGGYLTNKEEEIFARPTQSLLQKWLREVHNINVNVIVFKGANYYYDYTIFEYPELDFGNEDYNTYEGALEEGLYQALKSI